MSEWIEQLRVQGRRICSALHDELGNNLVSCCMYGSVIRGDAVEGRSGLNLFLLLAESDQAAHAAVSRVLGKTDIVDVFMVGAKGFDRTVRAFASKFSSIQRHYELVAGADVLRDLKIDAALERFLCEQALRNLQLRLGYTYIRRKTGSSYERHLKKGVMTFFVHTSEILRLTGLTVPDMHEDRIRLIASTFGIREEVVVGMLELRYRKTRLSSAEQDEWHEQFLATLNQVFDWLEGNWGAGAEGIAESRAGH